MNRNLPRGKFLYLSVFLFLLFVLGVSLFWLNVSLVNEGFQTSRSEKQAFEIVYDQKLWGEGSGIGSHAENARPYLNLLQSYLNDPRFISIVDLGCGDWNLMSNLSIPNNKLYIGYDLIDGLIKKNRNKYGKKNIQFVTIDRLSDFKDVKGDLLIVKDVLHHWPNEQINYFLANILPNFRFALITNDFNLYSTNPDIHFAEFRAINLQSKPFLTIRELRVLLDYPSHGIKKRVYTYQNPNQK